MHKYVDDSYLVVPANNINSSVAEKSRIEWATENNLVLNFRKSVEIYFEPSKYQYQLFPILRVLTRLKRSV